MRIFILNKYHQTPYLEHSALVRYLEMVSNRLAEQK